MKKIAARIVCFVLVSLAWALSAHAQRSAAPVTLKKVTDRVYGVEGGSGAQSGVIVGDDCVAVIDAKMDEASQKAVFVEIARLTQKPVKYLVNTHGDGDHINGNRYFPSTVTIVAHDGCRKDFFLPGRNGNPSEWTKPELLQFIPSVTFFDRMNLYIGGVTVELHHFGTGHTTGDTVVYIPSEKTAFTGDQVSLPMATYIHAYKGGNTFAHVRNLEKMLAAIDAEHFVTGHSGVTDRAGVRTSIDNMKAFQNRIRALMGEKKSLDDIKKEFPANASSVAEIVYKEISEGRER